jgi:hypothetical protein
MSKFIWYDLMTPDLDQARDFYTHVVGWTAEDSGVPGMDYTVFKAGDIMVGGMMATPPAMMENAADRPWMGHVYVDSVDIAAGRAESLGGRIYLPAADIPEVGRFAVLGDVSGAAFIVFKPSSDDQQEKVPDGTPGHIGWRELMSSDRQKDWAFYEALFGWRKSEAMDMGSMGTYQIFDTAGGQSGGMMTRPPGDPHPPHWNYYINVASLRAAMNRANARGTTFTGEAMAVPGGGWAVTGHDPIGHPFALFSTVM